MAIITLKSNLSNESNRFDNAPKSNTIFNKRVLIDPKTPMLSLNLLNIKPTFKDYNTRLNPNIKFSLFDLAFTSPLRYQQFLGDQPGYGSSGLPYVKSSLLTSADYGTDYVNTGAPGFPLFKPGTTGGPDYPIRGGQAGFVPFETFFTPSGKIDRFRIQRFFKDPARGTTFLQKQVSLQLSNPKIETGPGALFGFPSVLGSFGPIENTRTYNNGLNTLMQVEASGTGAHAVRHGLVPFNPFQKNYFQTVNEQNILGDEDGSFKNRLLLLFNTKMTQNQDVVSYNLLNSLGISLNRNILFQYLGGPGSTYGVGTTTINRYVDTAKLASQNTRIPEELRLNYQKYGLFNASGQNLPTNKINTEAKTIPPLENRLLLLSKMKMWSIPDIYGDYINTEKTANEELININKWGISRSGNLLFFYNNGPGAATRDEKTGKVTVDKSKTGIRRYVNTTSVKNVRTMTYRQLSQMKVNESVYETSKDRNEGTKSLKYREIQDFRTFTGAETPMGKWNKTDSVDYKFYVLGSKIDKLNTLYPFYFDNSKAPWETEVISDKSTKDIIKFVFEAISNNNTSISTALFFRAFLTSQITDNHTGKWNNFQYMGRGENFYTYQGFDRSLSFSFRMYASSPREMKAMYSRLNNLISQVYPDYSANNIMRAPVMRLTIGDYINRMPGFLESVNVSVDQNSSWEILDDDLHSQLPHMIDVTVSFKPILEELPRRANTLNTPYVPSIVANNGKTIMPVLTNQAPSEPLSPIIRGEDTSIEEYRQSTIAQEEAQVFQRVMNEAQQASDLEKMVSEISSKEDYEPMEWTKEWKINYYQQYAQQYVPSANDLTGTTTAFPN